MEVKTAVDTFQSLPHEQPPTEFTDLPPKHHLVRTIHTPVHSPCER
jgi:hypothetical protein